MYDINTNKIGIFFKKAGGGGGGCHAITTCGFVSKHVANSAS